MNAFSRFALVGAVLLAAGASAAGPASAQSCDGSDAVCFFLADAPMRAVYDPETTGSIRRIEQCGYLQVVDGIRIGSECGSERQSSFDQPANDPQPQPDPGPTDLNSTLR